MRTHLGCAAALHGAALLAGPTHLRTLPARLSLDPSAWKLFSSAEGGLVLSPADAGYEAKLITATIPRTADAPSLGLVLDEIIGDDEKGIVAIESLVEGGNGERSDVAIEPGDALVAVAAAGDPNSGVSLEGLPYDGTYSRPLTELENIS